MEKIVILYKLTIVPFILPILNEKVEKMEVIKKGKKEMETKTKKGKHKNNFNCAHFFVNFTFSFQYFVENFKFLWLLVNIFLSDFHFQIDFYFRYFKIFLLFYFCILRIFPYFNFSSF